MRRAQMRLNLSSLYMEQDGPPLPQSAPPVMQCDFRYESDGILDGYVEAHKRRLVRSTEMLQLHTLVQTLSEDLNSKNEENRKLCEVSQQLQEETMKWKKEAMRFRTYLQAILHVDHLDLPFPSDHGTFGDEVKVYSQAAAKLGRLVDSQAMQTHVAQMMAHHFLHEDGAQHPFEGANSPHSIRNGNGLDSCLQVGSIGRAVTGFPLDEYLAHMGLCVGMNRGRCTPNGGDVPQVNGDASKGQPHQQCTTPCSHDRVYWKHLRTKAAQRHMVCTFCGHKWRQQTSPARGFFPKPPSPVQQALPPILQPPPATSPTARSAPPTPTELNSCRSPSEGSSSPVLESGQLTRTTAPHPTPATDGGAPAYPICVTRKPRRNMEEASSHQGSDQQH
eukprot:GGOE01002944.1.p1 GENE.GGOE01002944.1~~GGOE01002944.1.p1  ORF type:complete len:390 (+),score=42.95 GGOE01002944.1:67-1236(+)